MNTSKKTPKRAVFTTDKELKLLEFIEKEKHIIENKTTNKQTNEDKDLAWKRVTNAYNAVAVEHRTLEQLRSKFDNLKTKTRKLVAEKKAYVRGTCGGGALPELDPVSELMLKIINWKTVVGLESEFDNDNDQVENESNKENEAHINIPAAEETIFATISEDQVILELENSAAQEVLQEQESHAPRKRTWNKYTTRRLKEPMSKKLRPTIPNPVFDKKQEYYSKKCENVEQEILARKAQEKRLAEEHDRKMQLLQLEIRLKQEELRVKYNVFL